MATRKQKEIAELLRREISSIVLHELSDPRTGFVTLTRVQVTGDYRSARVYVTVRGEEADVKKTLAALTHARGHIQALVAKRIKLRWTPVLEFVEDSELTEALRIDRLLDQVSRDRVETTHADGDPSEGSVEGDSESARIEETP